MSRMSAIESSRKPNNASAVIPIIYIRAKIVIKIQSFIIFANHVLIDLAVEHVCDDLPVSGEVILSML